MKIFFFLLSIFFYSSLLPAQNYYYTLCPPSSVKTLNNKQFTEMVSKPTPVGNSGKLKVVGNKIMGENGQPVQLRGMSFMSSEHLNEFWNKDAVKWLVKDWKCTLLRFPVSPGGNLMEQKKLLKKVIEACIEEGIYAIIDWHGFALDANNNTKAAASFFSEMADIYGDHPNIIFEIWNEPVNEDWNSEVKPFHSRVIAAIREHSDNIIVCGSPGYSGGSAFSDIISNPVEGNNIAYTLHFYAGSYSKNLWKNADKILNADLALFTTEHGGVEHTGDGAIDGYTLKLWWEWMDQNSISSVAWCVEAFRETSSILKENLHLTVPGGGWTTEQLTPNGIIMRNQLREKSLGPLTVLPLFTIEDSSEILIRENKVYPKGWVIKESDTDIEKLADGMNVYTFLKSNDEQEIEHPILSSVKLTGTPIYKFDNSTTYPAAAVFDNDTSTISKFQWWAENDKYIGIDLGAGNEKTITKVRIYPRIEWGRLFIEDIHHLSVEGGNLIPTAGYSDLGYSGTEPSEADWYEIKITDRTKYRFIRVLKPRGMEELTVGEVEFYGY